MTVATPEQARAANASEKATEVNSHQSTQFKKDYRSYVDRLGPAIVMNGLGQALAMELAAAGGDTGSAHSRLYNNVGDWLCREDGVYTCRGNDSVLDSLIKGTQDQYLLAQTEALAWLQWHKNLCRALLPRDRDLNPMGDQ